MPSSWRAWTATRTSFVRWSAPGIPVMGHIGLTPQSVNQFGGYRVQGKRATLAAAMLIRQAQLWRVWAAFRSCSSAFRPLWRRSITGELAIPTIGIGAGAGTDGQVLGAPRSLGSGAEPCAKIRAPIRRRRPRAHRRPRSSTTTDVKHARFPTAEESYT